MAGCCESCSVSFTESTIKVKCQAFCSVTFCLRCSGLDEQTLAIASRNNLLIWRCRACKGLMDKARFRNAFVSAENANAQVLEEIKNEICNQVRSDLLREIRKNFDSMAQATPRSFRRDDLSSKRMMQPISAKRGRELEEFGNDATSRRPAKLFRGTDMANSAAPQEVSEENGFHMYLTGISPEVTDGDVLELAKCALGTNE